MDQDPNGNHQPPDTESETRDEMWSIKDLGISLLFLFIGAAGIAVMIGVIRKQYWWLMSCSALLGSLLFLLLGLNGFLQSLNAGWRGLWHEQDHTHQ